VRSRTDSAARREGRVVYDALVSPRVYRDAWSHDSALRLLHEESGTAFDPACVEALEKVLADVPAVQPRLAAAYA
jgi:HD-GYP domain-containing protein (c-di-GMP phosphodiesterase class II)